MLLPFLTLFSYTPFTVQPHRQDAELNEPLVWPRVAVLINYPRHSLCMLGMKFTFMQSTGSWLCKFCWVLQGEFKQNLSGWVHAFMWSHFFLSEIAHCLFCGCFLAWVQFYMQLVKHPLLPYLPCCEQLALRKGMHSEAGIPGIPVNLHWQCAYKEGADSPAGIKC